MRKHWVDIRKWNPDGQGKALYKFDIQKFTRLYVGSPDNVVFIWLLDHQLISNTYAPNRTSKFNGFLLSWLVSCFCVDF